jgi:hypothetical protein
VTVLLPWLKHSGLPGGLEASVEHPHVYDLCLIM